MLRRSSFSRDFNQLQREMNRLFEELGTTSSRSIRGFPAVNIWLSEDGAILTAELPGMKADQIDISVTGESLTLSGEKVPEELPEAARYHRQECGCGKFSRTIQLPFKVDSKKIDAVFERGVLRITLKRVEEDKPRKIKVKTGK
jgi:HSP20 family protein